MRLACPPPDTREQTARPGSASIDRFEAGDRELQQVEREKVRTGGAGRVGLVNHVQPGSH